MIDSASSSNAAGEIAEATGAVSVGELLSSVLSEVLPESELPTFTEESVTVPEEDPVESPEKSFKPNEAFLATLAIPASDPEIEPEEATRTSAECEEADFPRTPERVIRFHRLEALEPLFEKVR